MNPMIFEPRITTDVSRSDATSPVWIFHLPGGHTEIGGKCGVVARNIAIDLYVKRLSRFGHLCDPADVQAAFAPTDAAPTAVQEKRKQYEIVLGALKNGAITSSDVSRDTGIPASAVSAILSCQLEAKGMAHRTGRDGVTILWAPGPDPAADKPSLPSPAPPQRPDPVFAFAPIVTAPADSVKTEPARKPDPVVEPIYTHKTTVKLGNGGSIEMRLSCNVFTLNENDRAFLFDMVDRFATYRESCGSK